MSDATLTTITFYVLSFCVIAGGIFVVSSRNLFHSAVFLVMTLFSVAGIFVMLNAYLLAAVQVLIYVGAVAMLMIFGVMLTTQLTSIRLRYTNEQVWPALVICLFFLGFLAYGLIHTQFKTVTAAMPADVSRTIGALLMTKYVLPFEVVSLLLLAALVGAIVIAKRDW
jgi:NADH:ubiquinone oxidoreductase subunit 6 (subunit J)